MLLRYLYADACRARGRVSGSTPGHRDSFPVSAESLAAHSLERQSPVVLVSALELLTSRSSTVARTTHDRQIPRIQEDHAMIRLARLTLSLLFITAGFSHADETPSWNGFLPEETAPNSGFQLDGQGHQKRSWVNMPASSGEPVPGAQLPTPPSPVIPIVDGQVPMVRPDSRYSVELLIHAGSGYTLVLCDAERYMASKQAEGFVVSKTEQYVINNGTTQIFHIVHWYQWKSCYTGEEPATALRFAQEYRVHYPYVRVLHHQLVQPGWWDANMSVRLNADQPHWETKITGW